ncbi:MAG TPA: argininosuccinate lyase, partial [Thermoplasmata archaeon]|nr:argininosuccinate lyase [Thermoplasmata archaeon]
HTTRVLTALGDVVDSLVRQAAGPAGRFVLPEATHLQDAQHVYLAQHLLVHAHRFLRDARRLEHVLTSVSASPLGAAAVAGSSLPLDRKATARALGFERPVPNSVDAVSDRDFAVEGLNAMALLGVHASSLAEELVLWSTPSYSRVRMADGYVTTSSLMPHKRNPDMAELLRGESGALIGLLVAHLTVLKGLPLSYNRDLQVAKPLLFEAFERLEVSLPVLSGMVRTTEFSDRRIGGPPPPPPSVELVDQLVRQGVAFRLAHEEVARKLSALEGRGESLIGLSSRRLNQLFPQLPAGWSFPTPVQEVERRTTMGGSSWREVSQDLRGVRAELIRLQRAQRERKRVWSAWTWNLLHDRKAP